LVKLYNEILGKEVDLPERPRRIVSFSPALTEGVYAIGRGESLVGVSAFCSRPIQVREKRRVGSYNTVSYDLLDELRPDLILAVTGYQRDFSLRLSERYPVYPLELPVSVAGIVDAVVKLGLITNAADDARRVAADLLARLSLIKKRAEGPKVYVEIDLGGPVSFGSHSYITDALHLLGTTTVYDEVRAEWLTPDFDAVTRADPEVMIFEAKMFSHFSLDDLRAHLKERRWNELSCVKGGRCYLTPGPLDFLAHHGPSFVVEVMPWLQERLSTSISVQK